LKIHCLQTGKYKKIKENRKGISDLISEESVSRCRQMYRH